MALHNWLGLGLLVSRQLIMMAASRVKLTSSQIPQQAASSSIQVCKKGCCQSAVNNLPVL
jgi:hypothetical protein